MNAKMAFHLPCEKEVRETLSLLPRLERARIRAILNEIDPEPDAAKEELAKLRESIRSVHQSTIEQLCNELRRRGVEVEFRGPAEIEPCVMCKTLEGQNAVLRDWYAMASERASKAEARASELADVCQTHDDEWRKVDTENGRLRRKLERLEKNAS